MSSDPHLYSHLAASLAPSIWEMEDVKKGVLLQLFGGCVKDFGKEGKMRGEVNILLVGDPGVAKSQLLSYVHKLSSRGIYTSGKGSSAVGLTASIGKDPETREPVLESGALVLSDRGVCCIDEFDKMSETTRVILHEVMEQQTVSIAKAGIIATLNARTSILAAANPIESRYNPKLSIVENLQLPPTLLSRFDLIYLLLDQENPESDAQLAAHLVSLYEDAEEKQKRKTQEAAAASSELAAGGAGNAPLGAVYSTSQVAEYISYARAYCTPRITDEARAVIVAGYVEMRKLGLRGGNGGKKTITATTRQLESIIRLSEAHARMRLSRTVDPQDVNEALRLIKVATQTAAIDPRTGQIDMSRLITGHSAEEGDIVNRLVNLLRENFSNKSRNYTITIGQLVKDLAAMGAAGNMAAMIPDSSADPAAAAADAEYGGGGPSSAADALPPGALLGISAEEVHEALRILEADDKPIIRLQQGTGKVMVIG
jgi:DNA replication licensing factor MCM4